MAKIKDGVNGSFSGKVGNVVGSRWNGIEYIRRAPRKRTKPLSEKEKQTRNNFKVVHTWVHPLLDFVRVGFKGYAPTVYGFNAAKSVIHKQALVKDGFNSWVDPSLAKVSCGDLGMSENMTAVLNEDRKVVFTWDTQINSEMSLRDQVMLLAYDPVISERRYTTCGEFRWKGADSLDLSTAPSGTYYLYAAFVAEDRSRQSDSVYLGEVEV